jgi:hypothetical protein
MRNLFFIKDVFFLLCFQILSSSEQLSESSDDTQLTSWKVQMVLSYLERLEEDRLSCSQDQHVNDLCGPAFLEKLHEEGIKDVLVRR